MNNKILEIIIYVSAALTALGVFLPITSLPIYGEVSYHRIANMEAYLVIVFCFLAPLLNLIAKPRLALLAPLGVWLTLLFPAIEAQFKRDDSGFIGKLGSKATSAMQDFAVDLFLNIVEFSWGGYVFLAGILLFTIASLLRAIK